MNIKYSLFNDWPKWHTDTRTNKEYLRLWRHQGITFYFRHPNYNTQRSRRGNAGRSFYLFITSSVLWYNFVVLTFPSQLKLARPLNKSLQQASIQLKFTFLHIFIFVKLRSRSRVRSQIGPKGPRTKDKRPGPGLYTKFGCHHHSPPTTKLFFRR